MISAYSTGYEKSIKVASLVLMALGVVMIYSAGSRVDHEPHGFEWLADIASKQVIFVVAAFGLMLIVSSFDYRRLGYKGDFWTWPGWLLLILAVIFLAAVYVPALGLEVNGARRWLKVGPLSFQPSEFAKFALVVFLAAALSRREYPRKKFFKGLLPLCIATGVVCALIGKEDFGTAALIALSAVILLITAGVRIWQMIILGLPAAAGFVYLVICSPYRLRRITAFTDIWADPQGAGYHAVQSLIAIGRGSWWGVGLGSGLQKYGYLPEDTTDFIFSIICEELGLPGAILVIALTVILVLSGWQILRRTRDDLGFLLTFGVISTIGLQAAMNIAVATVSVPTKGIALPFVSAGGSGLIFSAMALGLVCSVARYGCVQADRGMSVS